MGAVYDISDQVLFFAKKDAHLDRIFLLFCKQQRHQRYMPNGTHHKVLPRVPLRVCCSQSHGDCHHQHGFFMNMVAEYEAAQAGVDCSWQAGFWPGTLPEAEEAREQSQEH